MEPAKTASIQVWGKGFKVTADTEEFQRLLPTADVSFELEKSLRRFGGWVPVIEQLKQMSAHDLQQQSLVLLRPDHLAAVAVAGSEDKYGRWSPVVVMATTSIDWGVDDIGDTIAKVSNLASRLATEYGGIFRGAKSPVQVQLRDGTFLPEPSFQLSFEAGHNTELWSEIVVAVREWQGVTGVGTPALAALGANVLVGTKHELSLVSGLQYDGRYDVNDKRIEAIGPSLRRWPKKVAAPALPPPPSNTAPADLRRVERHLESMDNSLQRMAGAFVDLIEAVEAIVIGRPRRK